MIKLLILGPTGFTSKLIGQLAIKDDEIKVVAACDISQIDEDLGTTIGIIDLNKVKITDVNHLELKPKSFNPDVNAPSVNLLTGRDEHLNAVIAFRNTAKKELLQMAPNFIGSFATTLSLQKA